jgi:hypothetical protein
MFRDLSGGDATAAPDSMGLVVNFETGSVKGFDLIGVDPQITAKDADRIYFGVTYNDGFHTSMSGVLDQSLRVVSLGGINVASGK